MIYLDCKEHITTLISLFRSINGDETGDFTNTLNDDDDDETVI